jgi:hypothetical protein
MALASVWLGVFGLYLFYNWTVQGGGPGDSAWGNVHLIRFYLPALGPIALLAAWPLLRLPKALAMTALAAVVVFGVLSYGSMASAAGVRGPGGAGGAACGPPPGRGTRGEPPGAFDGAGGPSGSGSAPPTGRLPLGPPPGGTGAGGGQPAAGAGTGGPAGCAGGR